ncbi:MAG: hypothetical protein IPH06_09350 [Alphaproteobacteria bacterium]|nr:hypothetical protein [Alphaproteobacteria bacterium]QQS58200.1 MAG: hypothetical protein IPN28_05110 [Alphaproteobacteria bacterium]
MGRNEGDTSASSDREFQSAASPAAYRSLSEFEALSTGQYADWLRQECSLLNSEKGNGFVLGCIGLLVTDRQASDYCNSAAIGRLYQRLSEPQKSNLLEALLTVKNETIDDPKAHEKMPGRWWSLNDSLNYAIQDIMLQQENAADLEALRTKIEESVPNADPKMQGEVFAQLDMRIKALKRAETRVNPNALTK